MIKLNFVANDFLYFLFATRSDEFRTDSNATGCDEEVKVNRLD